MFANRRTVLHIDDDPSVTDLVTQLLKQEGYESEAVNDPLLAVDALVKGQHRVVLLDIHMPTRCGLQLLTEIKTIDAGIQVVMLTGVVHEATIIEAMRQGAEACLIKPLSDPALLLDVIGDAFKRNDRWWHTMRDLSSRRKEEKREVERAVAEAAGA